jgi:putative hemolysin
LRDARREVPKSKTLTAADQRREAPALAFCAKKPFRRRARRTRLAVGSDRIRPLDSEGKMSFGKIAAAFAALICLSLAGAQAARADESRAAAYCVKKGGVVQTRIAEYGTNGGSPLVLSGKREFCQFSAKDGSQINLLLSTLFTKQPTLAALAYYAQVEMSGDCSGNPASCYCTQLGGSDLFGGIDAAGGGWVLDTDPNDVLESCVFPDMSSIDSWGLAYHSVGTIRGKDLAKVLRYPNPYPAARRAPSKMPYRHARTLRTL